MRRLLFIIISALFPLMTFAQNRNVGADCQLNESAFEAAYKAFPQIPKGLLEAVSFTNTHCHHLTDADYTFDDSTAMPRAYGLMGLVKNGKNYFRENLLRCRNFLESRSARCWKVQVQMSWRMLRLLQKSMMAKE